MDEVDSARLTRAVVAIAAALEADKDRLCRLDGEIGDGDHGIAMALGFGAARDAVMAPELAAGEPSALLNGVARSFLNAVGASCGPLYATAFMRAGAAAKGKPVLDTAGVVAMVQAMAKGIQDRGKAEPGEKTMLDAWSPATAAASEAVAKGEGLRAALDAAVAAAEAGAAATVNMVAGKGRASRLGERARGHMDPGAASAVVVIRALRDALVDGQE